VPKTQIVQGMATTHNRNDARNALAKEQSSKKPLLGRKSWHPRMMREGLNFLVSEPLFGAARLGIRLGFHFVPQGRKGEISKLPSLFNEASRVREEWRRG